MERLLIHSSETQHRVDDYQHESHQANRGHPKIIAAMLISGYSGCFKLWQSLDCTTCDEDTKKYLGCGAEPVLDGVAFQPWVFQLRGNLEGWNHETVNTRAAERYRFAPYGDVWARWAFIWPHCPRWYLAKASRIERAIAERVLMHAKMVRLGKTDVKEYTHCGEDLLRRTLEYWEYCQSEYDAMRMEEVRSG